MGTEFAESEIGAKPKDEPKKVQPLVIISMPNADDEIVKQIEQVIEAYAHGICPVYITRQQLQVLDIQDLKDIIREYETRVK